MSLSSVILARSPVRYLAMQETSGTAAVDSSTNAIDGTYNGGVVVNDTTDTAAPAGVGKHVRLDGTNGYVQFDTSAFVTHTTTGWSIEFWACARSYIQYARYFDFANAASSSWDFMYMDPNSNQLSISSGGSLISFVNPIPAANVWHHYVFTKTSTGVTTCYQDAVQKFQNTYPESANAMQFKYLGKSQYADPYAPISISQAAVYNAVLTPAQVLASFVEGAQQLPGKITLQAAVGLNTQVDLYATTDQYAQTYDYRVNGGTPVTGLASPNISVTGLTNGTSYTFEVRAVNSVGAGAWSKVVTAYAGTPLLYDSFNRANAVPASGALGTPDVGSAWVAGTGAIGIQSNRAYTTATQENVYTVPGVSDIDLQYQVVVGGLDTSLIWRFKDTSNYWLMNYTGVYRKVAGSFTVIVNPLPILGSAAFWVAGDVFRVICLSNWFYLFKNGKFIYAVDDLYYDPVNNTGIGMRLQSSGNQIEWIHGKATNTTELGVIIGGGASPVDLSSLPDGPFHPTSLLYKGRDTAALDAGSVP